MRFSTPTLVLALLAIGGVDVGAHAAPGKAVDPEKIFSRKDANSDGFLSAEEFKAGKKDKQLANADKRFKKIDTDADGRLSLDEFKAGMPKPKE